MIIDSGMIAAFVTILLAIIGLAAWVGGLGQKVRNQNGKIEFNRKATERELERLHNENREDHRQLFTKMEEINTLLRDKKA